MTPAQRTAQLVRRLRFLFSKRDTERDMNEEMRIHLEFEIDDRINRGMSPTEARRTAMVDFGGMERFKEEARVARGVRVIEDLVQDAEYALRVLRRSPTFALTTILTVAIGIAATVTVFSAVNAILFRPPPVRNPAELYTVAEVWKSGMRSWRTDMAQYMYFYKHFLDVREHTTSVFDGLAGYRYGSVAVRSGDDTRAMNSMAVTPNFFHVLGIHPTLGQLFTDTAQYENKRIPEAVIGYNLWQREFEGDSGVIGRSMYVDSRMVTIVGVAPKSFHGVMIGLAADLWLPATNSQLVMIGRLRAGMTKKRALVALATIAPRITPEASDQQIAKLTLDAIVGPPAMSRGVVIGFMGVLFVTSALVLLIVTANIAGMFLARAAQRRREIAVRLAMGASRGRIVRQLLTESIGLCVLGGGLGTLLATWLIRIVPAIDLPTGQRALLELRMDPIVLLVSCVATLIAGVTAGLTPALQSTRMDVVSGLRGTRARGAHQRMRARTVFVVAQLATSLILLFVGGMFTRALQRAMQTNSGMSVDNVVVAEVNLSAHGYDRGRGEAFYRALMMRLASAPDVATAALGQWTPLAFGHNSADMTAADGERMSVTFGVADTGYLNTMRIPLVAGRAFSAGDASSSAPVAIVNETFARRMWPGQSVLGNQIKLNGDRTIVGVIRDGKYRNLDESPVAYAFMPFSQYYSPRMVVHVRPRGDVGSAIAALRRELRSLNPNVALEKVSRLDEQLSIYYLPQRFAAWCIGAFGVLGLGLAALGVYGVMAFQVANRTREFGIRMALGAHGRDITRAVLRPAVQVFAIALVIGVPMAVGAETMARSFLYGVGALDVLTFGSVISLFAAVIVVASYRPARRAARVDPVVSLRVE